MRFLLPTALGVLLLCIHTPTLGCETNCCWKSTDCSNTDCCSKSSCQTTNCCQTTSTNCSQVTNYSIKCHVHCRNSTCTDQCKQECCTKDTRKDEDIDVSDKVIVNNNDRQPPSVEHTSTNNVNNNNNHNISAKIGINNIVSYENRIFIPINVSNSNFNNVAISSSGYNPSPKESTTLRPSPTDHITHVTPPSPTTPCPTHIVKVPVPIPVPGEPKLIPIPYPIPYPVPQPSFGCCIIMNPCVSYGCHSYHRTCGGECSHNFLYNPMDPCSGNCHKKQFGINRHCSWSGQCHHSWMDCSMCDTNFYESYDGYQQCGGCFYR